jgi:hypothetical protein
MKKPEQNYFGLLAIGMMFIILSATSNGNTKPVFIFLGIIFLIVYFVNKNKWIK